jgi:glycosyltransferase involved in cell wall biosynthesis
VRIPTYHRPQLLKRALNCLRNQTYENWVALVIDDDMQTSESREVVRSLNDPRIRYSRNCRRLGAAANLDHAFRTRAMMGGSYAFVLEDDNGILPDFISENVGIVERGNHAMLLRNQIIYDQGDGSCWCPTQGQTKGWYYGSESEVSCLEVQGSIFFDDCIANGGLFWDTQRTRSELFVGECVADSGIQEFCRTVQIVEPIIFGAEPLGIWTRMARSKSVRSYESNRAFGRAVQHLRMMCVKAHGRKLIEQLRRTAIRLSEPEMLEKALLDSLHFSTVFKYIVSLNSKPIAKALARRLLVANPISEYRYVHRSSPELSG